MLKINKDQTRSILSRIMFTAASRGVLFEEYLNKFEQTRDDPDKIRSKSGNTYCVTNERTNEQTNEQTNINAN